MLLFILIRTQLKAALEVKLQVFSACVTQLLSLPCYCYLEVRPLVAYLDLARM